jgi:hypothetical protein
MEDLHTDFYIGGSVMHRLGYQSMSLSFSFCTELGGGESRFTLFVGHYDTALFIGRDTAGDDHANTTTCTLGVKRGHALKTICHLFEASMHRSHDGSIAKAGETQI